MIQATPQDELLAYYRQELGYLRRMGAEFAERYPAIAGRLALGGASSTDPHVERLLEAFALLTGRLQSRLDAEAPEVPSALLDILYPHLTTPIPSLSVAQFEPDPTQGKRTSGYRVERHTPLVTTTHDGQPCWFRTCYPVELWPLQIVSAGFERATAHGAAIWLRLQAQGVELSTLELERLRFHIHTEQTLVSVLYELLFCYGRDVYVVPGPGHATARTGELLALPESARLRADSLVPLGFEPEDDVLPHAAHVHPAYRLLQEFFAVPKKFHFFEVRNLNLRRLGSLFRMPDWPAQASGTAEFAELGSPALHQAFGNHGNSLGVSAALHQAFRNHGIPLAVSATIAADEPGPDGSVKSWLIREWAGESSQDRFRLRREDGGITVYPATGDQSTFEIWITLDGMATSTIASAESMSSQIDNGTFRLGCTPVINLFRQTTDPIRVRSNLSEYEVVPDGRRAKTTEIHTIQRVIAVGAAGTEAMDLAPLYGLDYPSLRTNQKTFWHARRQPVEQRGLTGTTMFLSLTDLALRPELSELETVYAQTLCTNRGLAETLAPGTRLQLEQPAPLRQVLLLSKPTPQKTPPLRGASLWWLVSSLALNHLSLNETVSFTIAESHWKVLNAGHPGPELRKEFAEHGLALSPRSTITASTPDYMWQINDPDGDHAYSVVREINRLVVTGQPGQQSVRALRALLALYASFGVAGDEERAQGIEQLTCRRVVRRVSADGWLGVARGIEITLVFDPGRFQGTSPFLFASVLNQFFALYVTANLFTQLVVRRTRTEGVWKQWPPMGGRQRLL